jgi:hypothetical protein
VVFIIHIDEVDDDNAAQIAQTQLARNRLRGFDIGIEDGVVRLRWPTNAPVLISTVVIASV